MHSKLVFALSFLLATVSVAVAQCQSNCLNDQATLQAVQDCGVTSNSCICTNYARLSTGCFDCLLSSADLQASYNRFCGSGGAGATGATGSATRTVTSTSSRATQTSTASPRFPASCTTCSTLQSELNLCEDTDLVCGCTAINRNGQACIDCMSAAGYTATSSSFYNSLTSVAGQCQAAASGLTTGTRTASSTPTADTSTGEPTPTRSTTITTIRSSTSSVSATSAVASLIPSAAPASFGYPSMKIGAGGLVAGVLIAVVGGW